MQDQDGQNNNIAESNVRLWKQQKLAIFATNASRKKFTSPRKGRHPYVKNRFWSSFMKGGREWAACD